MIQVIVFVLAVALANIGGWAACTENTGFRHDITLQTTCGIGVNTGTGCSLEAAGVTASPLQGCGGKCITPYACGQNSILEITGVEYKCYQYNSYVDFSYKLTKCDTKCEADSVANYASCLASQGGRWDRDSCKCVYDDIKDSVYYVCNDVISSSGSVVSQLYAVHIHFVNGVPQSVCGVNPSLTSGEGYKRYCPYSEKNGTCQQNGGDNVPPVGCSGSTCAEYPSDKMWPTAQCYAIVGATCYMRDLNSGNTFSCVCDGSCDYAYSEMFKGAQGTCKNPYKKPESSNSQPSSSNSQPPASSAVEPPPQSSGSEQPSSGASGESRDYTEQLNQIIANTQATMNNTGDISQWTQTTMNNTIDIKNNLSDIGVDVSNIRSHAQGIESNTGSIDSKLSTTNNLLQSLNNKDWSPQINVNPPEVNVNVGGDTIIVNADTAKSGAAILDFLRDAFNGLDFSSDYSENDTLGMGAKLKGTLDSIAEINRKADSIPNMSDQLGAAKQAYGAAYQTLVDSMNHAMGDSVNAWSSHITNNGVLTGSGSNDCPSILTRTWSISFPVGNNGFNVTIPAIGGQLCRPITILGGATFWTLSRVILRMVVAIMCMMWVYRAVIGADSNED